MITREDIALTLQILSSLELEVRSRATAGADDIDDEELKMDVNDVADLLQRLLAGEEVNLAARGGSPVPSRMRRHV